MAIKSMKPGDKDLSDTAENAGLRVSIGSKGNRAFYYRYRSPLNKSKTTSMTFGHYPDISLAEARVEFQGLKSVRKAGRCPKAERDHKRRQEEEERQAESRKLLNIKFTVTTMIDRYLEEYIEDRYIDGRKIPGARNKKAQRECRRTLEADAVRVLGSHPAVEVTRRDIVDLISAIIQRGSEVQAGNVLRELVAAYEYSIGMERFPDEFSNPALQAKERLKRTKVRLSSKPRGRFLDDAELVKLLKWLPGSGFSTTQKNVMRLTLWTGLRTGTVCRVEWSEVDLAKGTLFVPASKSKTGVGQSVQLPRQAVSFLEQLKLSTETYVFPSTRTGKPIQQRADGNHGGDFYLCQHSVVILVYIHHLLPFFEFLHLFKYTVLTFKNNWLRGVLSEFSGMKRKR